MQLRVLGPVDIQADDGRILTLPRRQARGLLAILLLEAGRPVPVQRLIDLLWADEPPAKAGQALRSYVTRIRSVLAEAGAAEHGIALTADRGGYLMTVDPDLVDAQRFRRLLTEARATTDLAERDRLLGTACALWRGPALHRAASDEMRERLCAELDELRVQAHEDLLATRIARGRHRDLLPELTRLTTEHPTRQRLVELHMLALYRDGRIADALALYAGTRERLAEELGLDPSPALQRLHTAILRGDPVPSSQEGPATATPAQLPRDIPSFTGRASHLERLDAVQRARGANGAAVVISAIAGTGGIGKSALAVHWGHRVRHMFPDGQLYLNLRAFDPATPPVRPAEAVRRSLDALGVPPQRIPADPDGQINLYRSLLTGKRMLVVLDNARDAEQVRPLLPGEPGCLVLITSRNQLTSLVAAEDAHPIALDVLSDEEARQLLVTRLGADRVTEEPEAVDEIISACAGLPLALVIVAAHAATDPSASLADLAKALHGGADRLDALTTGDAVADVRAVFSWSYRSLTPAAASLFRLFGLAPGPDISGAAAASLTGLAPARVRPLLAELVQAHLITEHVPGRYTMHDLLRAYAAELTAEHDSADGRRAAMHRLLDHHLHTADAADRLVHNIRDKAALPAVVPGVTTEQLADDDAVLDWFAAERPVLVALVEYAGAAGFDEHVWRLVWALAYFLEWHGHWQTLLTLGEAALAATRRLGNRVEEARALRGVARGLHLLNRNDEAAAHHRRALKLCGELGDLVGEAHSHYNLGNVYHQQGRYSDALRHMQLSRELYERIGHPVGRANALNGLGYVSMLAGDRERSLRYCRQALAAFQELDDRNGEAGTWDSLGAAYHHLGDHAKALASFHKALALCRKLGDRRGEGLTLSHLADTYEAMQDVAAAREHRRRALELLTDIGHPEADAVRAKLDTVAAGVR